VIERTNKKSDWRAAAGLAVVLAALGFAAAAFAQDNPKDGSAEAPAAAAAGKEDAKKSGEAEWPCPQKYVADLSWGSIWAGGDLTPALKSWHDNDKLRDIITLLSDDTTTENEAVKAINDFAGSLDGDKKQQLTELFAGLFETLSNQRTSAQAGIKRFFRRQEKVAARVNEIGADMRALDKKEVQHDSQEYLDAKTKLAWTNRVFDERQRLLPYMCDVPLIIERRLGTFARAIQGQIEGSPMEPPPEPEKT